VPRRACSILLVAIAVTRAHADEPDEISDDDASATATLRERLTRAFLWATGAGDGSQGAAASRARGADVAIDGTVGFAGATGAENRWTIGGFAVDSLATGALETRIPLAFLERVDIVTGGLPASATASTGGIIDARLRGGPGDAWRLARAWAGVSAPARGLRAIPERYDPFTLDRDDPYAFGALAGGGVDLDLPLVEDAWVSAGVAVSATHDGGTRRADRLRDADGDGRFDRNDDGTFALDRIDERRIGSRLLPSTVAMLRAGARRGRHTLELNLLDTYTTQQRLAAAATDDALVDDVAAHVTDAFATWTARAGSTRARLTAGWHRARRDESGADGVQIGTAYVPVDLPGDETLAAACDDTAADDPYPAVTNCPVPTGYFVRGGAGLLTDTASDRPAGTLDLTHRIATHRLGAGLTAEDARWVRTRRYTGGVLERRLAEDVVFTTRFVEFGDGPDDCGDFGACRFLDEDGQTFRTRYLAGWIEDAWEPAPGLHVQAGLRWESMEVGSVVRFRDQLAPRIAVALDPTRTGRARLFAAYGRYHALIVPGQAPAIVGDSDLYTHLASPIINDDLAETNPRLAIDAALQAPVVEEQLLGAEWSIAEDRVLLGASLRARGLRHGIADVDGSLVNANVRRNTRDLQLWLANAADATVHVRLSYVRQRARGSWSGPGDPLFDGTSGNAFGRLPQDLPYRWIAETSTSTARWTVGARFEIASGRPVGATAGPSGEVPLLPRGSLGRTPPTTAVTLHAAARLGRFELALDLLDVFDRRAPAAVDERWTLDDDVRPIEGGSEADLVWLRDIDGGEVRPNRGHGVATTYVAPLFGRLSLTAAF
jgi:hypothetical protein